MDVLKQKNVGAWWGAFRNLGSYVSFYITLANSVALLVNTYLLTNLSMFRGLPLPPWAIVGLIIVSVVGLLVLAMVFEHKYTLPSFMTYWNEQWWLHGNKLPGEIASLREQLDRIEKAIRGSRK